MKLPKKFNKKSNFIKYAKKMVEEDKARDGDKFKYHHDSGNISNGRIQIGPRGGITLEWIHKHKF